MTHSIWRLAPMALALAGCMSGADYAGRAVEHNRAIADAADQIVLLNIVRAEHDRPIVYSQFSGVSESLSNNIGVSLSAPFGADAAREYGSDLGIGPSQDATLSTAPLDDVDYYQGVMRPVKIGLLRYYLDNGWPPDLLIALTVEKLVISEDFYRRVVAESDAACAATVSGACGRIAEHRGALRLPPVERGRLTFSNDPRSPALFDPFHDLALRLIVLGLTVDGAVEMQETRLPGDAELYADAVMVEKLAEMDAEIRREGGSYVISRPVWKPGLRLTRLGDSKVRIEGEARAAKADLTASLRSPDSILFFLGAYVRPGGADAAVMVGAQGAESFVRALEIGGCDDAVVKVDFEDTCYGIPRGGDHLSMKVIGFLHQIFGLNKRAVEPPASGTVRVVN